MQLNEKITRNLHITNPNLHKFLKFIYPQDHQWKTATKSANHQLKVNCSVPKQSIIRGHHGTRTRSDFPLPVRQCAGHTASATGRPQSQVAEGSGLRFHQREGKSRDRRANKSRNSDDWRVIISVGASNRSVLFHIWKDHLGDSSSDNNNNYDYVEGEESSLDL